MREKDIERYFVKRVKEAGGKAYKWISPGHPGVPDRIVFHDGFVHFVELKAPRGKLRPTQVRAIHEINCLGFPAWVLDSKTSIDRWVDIHIRGI